MNKSGQLALRDELVETCRAMNKNGINRGMAGNVSVRFGDGFLVSPTAICYERMDAESVVFMRFDGSYDGSIKPSSEWRFHRDILYSRSDLNAVVHTHSSYATAMSILGYSIPAIHYSIASTRGPHIRCADYATYGTQELSDNVLVALKGCRACLMRHHGVIAAHKTMSDALILAMVVEELAKLYFICSEIREPPVLDDEEVARVIEKYRVHGQPRRTEEA